jgi:hypothetical protein
MAIRDIGALTGADEGLNHQVIETFATIIESDYSWTEKIWVSIAKSDGSVQAEFGLGKYHNRGIIDGFGGVSRGREQWTVRGSRELRSAPELAGLGPINYEIIDPLHAVRVQLLPNDVQPISFDIVLRGVTPPFFEERNLVRNRRTQRVDVNVIRYHQGGWATGTITVDGESYALSAEDAFGFRDHSWGVRQGVGVAPSDLIGSSRPTEARAPTRGIMKWSPSFFRRPDGTYYETAVFLTGGVWDYTSAFVNSPDGLQARVRSATPHMEYDTQTRFVRRGELHLVMETGEERVIEVEAAGNSGFFLKTAGYGPWKDHQHGSWRGPLHLDGEHIADCWAVEQLELLGQFRDTPVTVREGDATGFGIMQSIVSGEWPELGLTAASDRTVAYS